MTGNWIHIILVLVTAIQQIVGGVSCCCFVSVLVGSSSGMVIAGSSAGSATPGPARACCSKSKISVARVQYQPRPLDFAEKLSGDNCDCQLIRQHSKTEEPVTECQGRNPRGFYCIVVWATTSRSPWDDAAIRLSVDFAAMSSKFSHEPAPNALGKRLAMKSCWNI